jgi:hypothetical protein
VALATALLDVELVLIKKNDGTATVMGYKA